MNLVMVVHGPEAFDAGDAERLIGLLSPRRVLVAGVMARTAAEESGLPATCTDERPSVVLAGLAGQACLVNRGKTPESGRIFGELVAGRLEGLVHVECSSGTVYCWNGGDEGLAAEIADLTGYALVHATSARARQDGVREVRGCIPGEAVFVNGIVVGTATAETVVLASEGGTLRAVSGLDEKPHGIEKLLRAGLPEIAAAWCKSGVVRSVPPRQGRRVSRGGRVAIVDHCGHTLYRELDDEVCGVLAVGDDTTAVCGHICSHAGIPVFGVVDGDADTIVAPGYAPGSVVVEVLDGRDDDLGREVAATRDLLADCWEEWVEETLRTLGDRVRVVLDLRGG
ncbi:DUF2117 domain-containing protein [Methanoculleus sp. Wushi-C6]|uniref:DUF2117 domain-containing protein n=1 Tax=Methanoculleus caldifontis TaxID=2651577 RepID=A0ABU3WXC8_9EURY|nr:DUF2117 domain-containing protein [Methanoculleus sp. Wushi-C6]MDV2480446.1 DUF2117 domain-containing protein [Methanoculleus sp. Wushi-C6]